MKYGSQCQLCGVTNPRGGKKLKPKGQSLLQRMWPLALTWPSAPPTPTSTQPPGWGFYLQVCPRDATSHTGCCLLFWFPCSPAVCSSENEPEVTLSLTPQGVGLSHSGLPTAWEELSVSAVSTSCSPTLCSHNSTQASFNHITDARDHH